MAETKKTDTARYDRQLRLWGEEGQELVESAHLALLNATGTGTETLKNLVLPGIGNFTIIDGENVSEQDLGNNFFVTVDSIGKSRAETTCSLLQELNPLTKGHFIAKVTFAIFFKIISKNPAELIEKDINSFKQFTHIVANSLPQAALVSLSKFCWENKIPLIVERSYGFVGYLRVIVPEHTIVESKPDNPPDDLRLAEPFEELVKYVDSFDLTSMDSTDHSHTPYIIILLKAINDWRASHGGQLPSTRPEKEEFKSIVIRGSRNAQEENFNEAYRAAHKAFVKSTVPSSVSNILKDSNATNITSTSSKFWILASALKGFVDNEGSGLLPLMGTIPDMTAGTNGYIALQKVYQDKSNADISAVQARVKNILQSIGKPESFISFDEIKKFCKNSQFLQVVRYRSLQEELENPKSLFQNQELDTHLSFYIALRAVDNFYAKHNRYPGDKDATVESDVSEILKDSVDLVKKLNATKFNNDHIVELVQYGGVELHNMASLLGGVASQEVIKIVTHQYTPIDNTFIFNGLNSSSAVYSL